MKSEKLHVARENHIIDWDSARILDKEEHKKIRWIREAIWIRSRDSTMNRDGGTYIMSHIFDPLLKNTPGGKKRNFLETPKHPVITFPAPEVEQYQLQHQHSFEKVGCQSTKLSAKKRKFFHLDGLGKKLL